MNVVITGASRGIGKAIANIFAGNGYNLFLCSKNEKNLYATAEEFQTRFNGIAVQAKAFDLSDKEQAQAFGSWILEKTDAVDVLVNNAGTFIPGGVSNEPDGALEKMLALNLFAAYHVTRVVLPKMIEQRRGHIFNLSSIAALKAYPNGGAYSISKFAIAGFSKNLREEMKPHGIKVTTVYPGAVYTDSWKGSGVSQDRIMEAKDIAKSIFSVTQLSLQATVEEIVIRPQLGDL